MALVNGGGAEAVRDIAQFCGGFWEGLKIFGPGPDGHFTGAIAMGIVSAKSK